MLVLWRCVVVMGYYESSLLVRPAAVNHSLEFPRLVLLYLRDSVCFSVVLFRVASAFSAFLLLLGFCQSDGLQVSHVIFLDHVICSLHFRGLFVS